MKRSLLAVGILLTLSSGVLSSEIMGLISVIDADKGTLEVSGVEIITSEDWTIVTDLNKKPVTLDHIREGDYVEIEGRFIDPAKLEATRITVQKEIVSDPIFELVDETTGEEAQPEPATEEPVKQPEPAAEEPEKEPEPPAKAEDKLKGRLQNADVKTGILIVDGTIVELAPGAKVVGRNNKPLSRGKLRRGSRVACEGTRKSKKEFTAATVKVTK